MKRNKEVMETQWISLSDMMTSLMMVFLFVSVLFMQNIQKDLIAYKDTKQDLYEDLNFQFKDKFKTWDMVLDQDLTIKFSNPEVLFNYRSSEITPKFQEILSEFIPEYLAIITKNEYKDTISQVQIDGYTADWDDYMYTITLSQQRANAVLSFILNNKYYLNLSDDKKEEIKFWMTVNGFGNGRAIDKDGNYVFKSKQPVSPLSRRVEFRIVTKSSELIDKVINSNIK